ncbi:LysR family transcriptional regulator [Marinitenerispora sediminis]|uniref:LysR family transcriptional regulator n=1 Tax=Marinitenerispora sediminis TaxID=1931232 RepID=A0A368T5R4_9ACTN|nr:LysR family transcriptional regulator [Marinitenerispora sediminis]RCV47817.1 LysR family transcriptional regulator [Marinitenerispora sediminis]RCV54750.1 LysR family transcriptional regulator [Marinitenerispora sediminis]RCV58886.1 LysR family transcriptional regulator [Marinitenerispora sediminis]
MPHRFTLDQLRGFVAVADERHFGRAARRLNMTQPPLSRQIQKLEHALGVDLLVRPSRTVRLTPAGEAFLADARRMLGLADAAPLTARNAARGTAGALRIGFTAVSALTVLGGWLAAVRTNLPDVQLTLAEMVSRDQVEALLADRLHVGLARGIPASDLLSARRVHTESLILACPRDHPLARLRRPPTLAEIGRHDVVTYTPTAARYLNELVVSAFHDAGVQPRYVQQVEQVHSLLALVDAGLGVGLVPRSGSRLQLPGLAFTEIAGLRPNLVETHCLWRTDHGNPALAALLSLTATDAVIP